MKLMQKFGKSSPELVGGLMRVALEHILSILERGIFDQRTLEGMALAYYIICLLIKQNGSVLKAKLEKVQGDLIEMSLEVFDLCIGWRVEQSSRTVGVTGIVGVLQWSTCRCIQELLLNAKRESVVALLEAMKKTLGNETAGRFYYFLCREVGRGEFAPCMTDIVDVFVKTAVLCDTNAIHPDCRTSIVVLLNSIRARFHKNSGAKRLPNSVAAQHHRPAPVKPSGILHYRVSVLLVVPFHVTHEYSYRYCQKLSSLLALLGRSCPENKAPTMKIQQPELFQHLKLHVKLPVKCKLYLVRAVPTHPKTVKAERHRSMKAFGTM